VLADLDVTLRDAPPRLPFVADLRALREGEAFTFMTALGPLDLVAEPLGVASYKALRARAVSLPIAGLRVPVASLDHLIAMKRAAGRPKDLLMASEYQALADEGRRTGGVTHVMTHLVRSGLEELADAEFQRRVWRGQENGRMSSFVECVSTLFDDSDLGRALDRGTPVYEVEVDDQLRTLRELVARIDGSRSPDEILRDPLMPVARSAAAAALRSLNRVAGG
jgi:hypothetical protein